MINNFIHFKHLLQTHGNALLCFTLPHMNKRLLDEFLRHFRRLKRQPAPVELVEEAPEVRLALDDLAAVVDGPEQSLQRKEATRRIHHTLDQLPARYGRALEWKYIDGLPVKEIARRLELGPKAAESLLTRARVAFKEAFLAATDERPRGQAMRATSWSAALLSLA